MIDHIGLQSTIQKNNNVLTSILGDEMVMMNIEGGCYIGLNKTGRIIWEHLDQPILVKTLVENLTLRFNIEHDVCIADTIEYLENMRSQRIITIL